MALSGGGEIRTRGRLATSPVFKTGDDSPQVLSDQGTSEDDRAVLASSLALLTRRSPVLALLFQHWDAMPEAVRIAIDAMVKAALPAARERS